MDFLFSNRRRRDGIQIKMVMIEFKIAGHLVQETIEWCDENLNNDDWRTKRYNRWIKDNEKGISIILENREEAMAFKLRWL